MAQDEDRNEAAQAEATNEQTTAEPTLEERLAAAEAEAAELKDKWMRAAAEAENVRRRSQREIDEAKRYAISGFARELLNVADNLRRALTSIDRSKVQDPVVSNLLAGVEATERELLTVFERHGMQRIDPKGQKFDHNLHQAVFETESPDQPAGTVSEVLQTGWTIHDRLLRPAMVGVAKGGAAPERVDTTA